MANAPRILIVTSRYYAHIASELEASVVEGLEKVGATHEFLEVPGAFEIPGAIAMAASTGEWDGFVALGCVIRGETSHYDLITNHVARGLMELSISGVPLGFGVLTVENEEQAKVRADRKQKNKGAEVVAAVLRMVGLSYRFNKMDDIEE
ncbi:MAG: 6,7-dimethyl-8-ribityllumazine synthase [Alphaproteobacteria bacterium]|jgi:6,7-dimethyl-8-ribityllumazine synthase|nr:MAG: 6,7-dimethyl-8-ribityllumazine synthase [Alphaproteobacteria bacterium]